MVSSRWYLLTFKGKADAANVYSRLIKHHGENVCREQRARGFARVSLLLLKATAVLLKAKISDTLCRSDAIERLLPLKTQKGIRRARFQTMTCGVDIVVIVIKSSSWNLVHLTFQPLCIRIYPVSDSASKGASSFTVSPSQEDICALSLSNIFHLLVPQVQSNMEFTLLAFVYTLHHAGFFEI